MLQHLVCVCVQRFAFIWFSFGVEVGVIILASVAVVTKLADERSAGSLFSWQSEITSPFTRTSILLHVKTPDQNQADVSILLLQTEPRCSFQPRNQRFNQQISRNLSYGSYPDRISSHSHTASPSLPCWLQSERVYQACCKQRK